MTDLAALAKQAGLYDDDQAPLPKYLQAFAELVREDEREALAKLFEAHWRERWVDWEIADVIRTRTTT